MQNKALPETLCIFEDQRFPNFFPLSFNKPVFDLFIGTQTLKSRLIDELNPGLLVLFCRPYLAPMLIEQESAAKYDHPVQVNEIPDGEILFINGRLLTFGKELVELIEGLKEKSVVHKKGVKVAARLSGDKASSFIDHILEPLSDEKMTRVIQTIREASTSPEENNGRKRRDEKGEPDDETLIQWSENNGVTLESTGIRLLSHYWQLIGENGSCIIDDFKKNPMRGTAPETELFKGVDLINEEDIVIGSEVEVRSGTVLDASEGPIIIADRIRIEPNAIIYGPCYIGEGSIIRGGAKIGHGTSLGKECR
ncbi:MAG: hypothetical protein KAX38_08710, partial [Candidatus Krumholzibacteria bacterium]|nr:hypothetical protein [Candidatus Krumholzibacteria bacterium]